MCYVGITRAQKDLFLIHTRYRAKYGQRSACIPSRFLSEIPVDFVEEIDKTIYNSYSEKLRTESTTGYRDQQGRMIINMMQEIVIMMSCRNSRHDESQDSIELVSGDIVKHEIFGRGRVVKIAPSSDTVHVDFNRCRYEEAGIGICKFRKDRRLLPVINTNIKE